MDLTTFIKANISRKNPTNTPVSHPERGFDIVDRRALSLWQGWGWTEESWDVVSEPKGAKKTRKRRTKKSDAEKSE